MPDNQIPAKRGRGRPQPHRRIRIDPDYRDEIDHRKLARALLRLAQSEYDSQPPGRAKPAAPRASPVEARVRPHEADGTPQRAEAGKDRDVAGWRSSRAAEVAPTVAAIDAPEYGASYETP